MLEILLGTLKAGFHLGKLSSGQERTGKFPLCYRPEKNYPGWKPAGFN